MSRPRELTTKVTCNLSNESYNWNDELLKKRLEYYGNLNNLERYYIQAKFLRLLVKGKKLEDVAKLYKFKLEDAKQEYYQELLQFHKTRCKVEDKPIESTTTNIETDEDVAEFISEWAQHEVK